MWILSLIETLTGFIPRPAIIRTDEGGFRQVPKPWGGTWLTEMKAGQWYFLIPWIMEHEIIKIKPQVVDIRSQSVLTKDNIDIVVSTSIRYYVKDWMKAQLEVLDYDKSLQTIALMVVEEFIEKHTLEELKGSREVLKSNLLRAVKDESRGWGLQIQSVGITDIGRTFNLRLLTNSGSLFSVEG